jgi:hypothetical protein
VRRDGVFNQPQAVLGFAAMTEWLREAVDSVRSLVLFGLAILALAWCSSVDSRESATRAATERASGAWARYELVSEGAALDDVFRCTADCSGHRAGYLWAHENKAVRPEECRNHSRSFEEGCLVAIRDVLAIEDENELIARR